jgi:YVTN family beta-propeller protein
MKQFRLHSLGYTLALVAFLAACRESKVEPEVEPDPVAERQGVYVLAEGAFNGNNATLTYYNYESKASTMDKFSAENGRGLGDSANDIVVYGSKMYVIVNVSSTIEVVDSRTARSVKQIPVKNGESARQPRYIVFDKGKGYISNYDGTVAVLDTTTLSIEKYIPVGRNPEQLVIANGKLYVANSGGQEFLSGNYDKTVSVVNLTTQMEIAKIVVGMNPQIIAADQYGDVYVLSTGNYNDVGPSMSVIDSKTDGVKSTTPGFSGSDFVIKGDTAYIPDYSGMIKLFDVKTESLLSENFIKDGTTIMSIGGVTVDDLTGEVFVSDAKDYVSSGTVTCFNKAGVKQYSLTVGINPSKVVFINK